MPVSLKHLFTSPKADGTDATLVQPSNWNAEHTLTAGATSVLGNPTATAAAVQELTLGLGLAFSGSSIVAPAFRSINLQTIGPDGTTVVQNTNVIANDAVGGLRIRALDGITVVAVPGDANNRQMTLALTAHRDPIDFPDPHEQYVQEPAASGLMSFDTATGLATGRTLTQGAGITVTNGSGTAGNPTVANAGVLSITTSTGLSANTSATGNVSITNTGVTQATAGTGISVSASTGNVTFSNTGVTAITTSSGLSANTSATGSVSITNTGVTSLAAGTGISVSASTGGVTVSNTGVTSVNGQSGAVTVTAGTNNTAVTRTAPTASGSTALTTIQSYPVAAGEITPGSEYAFRASVRVINTTAASNLVVTLSVGATNVLVLTQAVGTTASAAPGKPVRIEGFITFYSATQAECYIRGFTSTAVAFDTGINTSAPITVAAAGATTIDLKVNTSAATSTFIARQATIQRVK